MQTKAEKNLANLLLKSEKKVSQLEQHLNLEKENVKIEKKKNKVLTEKLSRRNLSQTALKEEVIELKKTFRSKYRAYSY